MVYEGTISITDPEYTPARVRGILKAIGAKTRGWNAQTCEFEGCELDQRALAQLDDMWGPLVWCLTPRAA